MHDEPRQPDHARPRRSKRPADAALLAWVERSHDDLGDDLAEVDRQLAADPELRSELEALRRDRSLLRALASETGAEAIEPPADLMERIELALEREALLGDGSGSGHAAPGYDSAEVVSFPIRGRRRARGVGRWAGPAIAAMVVLAGGAILWLQPISGPSRTGPGPVPGAVSPNGPATLALAPESPSREDLFRTTPSPTLDLDGALPELADGGRSVPGLEAFADDDALREDLERILRRPAIAMGPDVVPREAARSAVPTGPNGLEARADVAARAGLSAVVVVDAARASELARAGRLGVAVRGDRPHTLREALGRAERAGLPATGVLRANLPLPVIASLPDALGAPPSTMFDLGRPAISRRHADARPPALEADDDGVAVRPRLATPASGPVALGYYTLELPAGAEALAEVRDALLAHLPEGSRVEFIELAEPVELRPEPSPGAILWWSGGPDGWRPRAAVPLVITDDGHP